MKLSIIIPTYNRSNRLSDLLYSLNNQNKTSFSWEVLVIDNNSTDDTKQVVNSHVNRSSISLRYIFEKNPGLHSGRNRGAYEARGEYLAYLDDDMILSPQWIHGVDLLSNGKADAVVGKILPKWEKKPPKWLLSLFDNGTFGTLGLLDLGDKIKQISPGLIFGGNCFISKKLIFDIGGFNPDGLPYKFLMFRGDGETGFFLKFAERGLIAYYYPKATAYHIINKERVTEDYLYKRAFNQGISNSFREIREDYSVDSKKPAKFLFIRKIIRIIRRRLGKIRRLIFIHEKGKNSIIERKIIKNAEEGFHYHQREVKKNPKLLEWILRKNYLGKNGVLPE